MIERSLVPGAIIRFPQNIIFETTKVMNQPQETNDDIQGMRVNVTTQVIKSQCNPFSTTKAYQVDFVPYGPGKVNYAETNGDVLSGIFSGCIMTIYTHNNTRRVAHVHTGDSAGPQGDCKAFMTDLLNRQEYTRVRSFKPFHPSSQTEPYIAAFKKLKKERQKHSNIGVLGLVTNQNQIYSALVTQEAEGRHVWKVVRRWVCDNQVVVL